MNFLKQKNNIILDNTQKVNQNFVFINMAAMNIKNYNMINLIIVITKKSIKNDIMIHNTASQSNWISIQCKQFLFAKIAMLQEL